MTTGDGGLEIDLESGSDKKQRDWKATGMSVAKFVVGFATVVAASWGALRPESDKVEVAYAITQKGVEALGEDMVETKSALSVLTKRYTDHLEKYHSLDKRLIRIESRLDFDMMDEDGIDDEQLDIIAELDAIRRELEDKPRPAPPESGVKTKGHGGGEKKAEPKPHITYEGQQIKLPDAEELFQ